MMCGGTTEARPVDGELKDKLVGLKAAVESKSGMTFTSFEPVLLKSQVVAGTNYFVKYNTGADTCVHARVHEPLPGQGDLQVTDVLNGKTPTDPIEYF